MRYLPIQEAHLIRRYQEQTLTAGIVVKSCHTALQTFSCLFYQLSACVAHLVCGPLARATCYFLKRRVNNLFKYFTVCYARPGCRSGAFLFWVKAPSGNTTVFITRAIMFYPNVSAIRHPQTTFYPLTARFFRAPARPHNLRQQKKRT